MKTHKTYSGMVKAANRLIAELQYEIADERDYRKLNAKVSGLLAELNALWSNPADAAEAGAIKNRLVDAWNKAACGF